MTDPAAPDLAIVGLKPCPFCGGPAAAQHYRTRSWGAGCVSNECQHTLTAEAYGTSRARAIAAWNARADSPKAAQCIEMLVAALTEAREYFDERADAECDPSGPGYTGNDEMRQLVAIDAALAKVRGR